MKLLRWAGKRTHALRPVQLREALQYCLRAYNLRQYAERFAQPSLNWLKTVLWLQGFRQNQWKTLRELPTF